MTAILQYIDGDSFFHRLHPLTKLFWAICMCAVCFICPNLYFLAAIVAINLLIAAFSKVFIDAIPTFKLFLILGLLLFLIQAVFTNEGKTVFSLFGVINFTDIGISSGLLLALRMNGALLPLSLMLMITSTNSLSNEMVEKLKIPYKYAFVVTTSLRFVPTFSDDMQQIIQAQVARGCELDTKNIFKKVKNILPLCLPLLVSEVRKIEKSAISLEVRGFDSGKRSSYKKLLFTVNDIIAIIYILLVITVGVILLVS